MGCNDKECRLLGLSPNPFQSYLVTVAGIHDAYVCVHVHVTRTVSSILLPRRPRSGSNVVVLLTQQQHASKIITIDLEVEKE